MQLQMQVMLTVPLKDPSQDISLGVIMYANYDSPTTFNSTQSIIMEPVDIDERTNRRRRARVRRDAFYQATEAFLETYVYCCIDIFLFFFFYHFVVVPR